MAIDTTGLPPIYRSKTMNSKKHKNQLTAYEILAELGVVLEYGVGEYHGRQIRYLEDSGILQIGDSEFDRWSNSVEIEFDLVSKRGQREFLRWIETNKI